MPTRVPLRRGYGIHATSVADNHACSHAQDIVKEAVKGVIILAILERLFLTRPVSWLEVRASSATLSFRRYRTPPRVIACVVRAAR
jgi:hypothetical protein